MRTNELMLYKHMENGQILEDMTFLMDHYDNEYYLSLIHISEPTRH